MNRRALLKGLSLAGAAAVLPRFSLAQNNFAPTIAYLESLARDDGGYGWAGQDHSHLTPTFFVIGSYRILNQPLPRKDHLTEFVRSHHPAALKKLEQERRIFEWQQAQALAWLGADPLPELKAKVLSWKQPLAYMKQYERHGYPLFSSEMGVILARALMNVPATDLPAPFVEYLQSRQRPNGSFNNTHASDASDGHIMSTWWALQASNAIRRPIEKKDELIAWVRSCQLPNGGFTFAPKPEFGGIDDIAYTWAAIRILKLLEAGSANREGTLAWLHSLMNDDSGFGDRPTWASTPMATYYALDALAAITELNSLPKTKPAPAHARPAIPAELKVFTIQIEAHGQGSPTEAVDLARSLRIHLWGAKNPKPGWIARAQAIADRQQVPVKFFVANEEYGTWVNIPGMGTYSHTSDIVAPAGSDFGPALAGQEPADWKTFRERRLVPLEKAGGRLVWQFGENEELVRMFLDDSVERGGYAAISTYHFGNPDFTNTEPFLHRWRGRIPYIALQDAHGAEPWWFADMTTGFRTLFLAKEPTWEAWLNALKENWVVPVRRDQWTAGKTWFHSGSDEALAFVRAREKEWRWWDNPQIQRPLVSLVAVRPEDQFETARPERGVTLRIRCAWQNTPQGLLKEPITELVNLTVNGAEVKTELYKKPSPNALLDDHYHFVQVDHLESATVLARNIATGAEIRRTLQL